MDAVPEREVMRGPGAVDVEHVGTVPDPLVAVRRSRAATAPCRPRASGRRASRRRASACAPSPGSNPRSGGSPRSRRGSAPGRRSPSPAPAGTAACASRQLPSSFVVVSFPAMISRNKKPTTWSSVSCSPSLSAATSAAARSSAPGIGPALGDERGEVLVELVRGVDARGRHVLVAFLAVQQARRSTPRSCSWSPSGTPSSFEITSIGSGAA